LLASRHPSRATDARQARRHLKATTALGMTIPESFRLRADVTIE
jgi:hypothetical protein